MTRPMNMTVISDLHDGQLVGFTPPSWDSADPVGSALRQEAWRMRRAIYGWARELIHAMPVPDVLLINGDAIDGKGYMSGGTELITSDRGEQVEMADAAIRDLFYRGNRRPKIFMSYGTGYHTGKKEDWENQLAVALGSNVEHLAGEGNFDIRGTIFNHKHHIGTSQIPHGRHTAISRDKLWNQLWALRGEFPSADVLIRSHVHYHAFSGNVEGVAMTTPALQGYGSKFGSRIPSGTVDVGFITFEIDNGKQYAWQPHIWRAPFKPATLVVED